MSDQPNPSPALQRPSQIKSFLNHLMVMPKLHKKLLAAAILLASGGTAGQVATYVSKNSDASQVAPASVSRSTPSNTIVSEGSTVEPSAAPARDPSVTERVSPVATKLGFGFIAGFVIGWVFRAFVKIMSLITMAGVALIGGLSYFNVEMSGIKTKFQSSMGWMSQQGEDLADKAMKRLPGSAAGVTGMVFGFKRKK